MVVVDLLLPTRSLPDTLTQLADQGHLAYHDESLLTSLLDLEAAGIPVVFAEAPDNQGTRILRGSSELLSLISSLGEQDDWFGYAQVPLDPDGYQRRYQASVSERATLAARAARHLGVETHDGIINFRVGDEVTYLPMQTVNSWYSSSDIDNLRQNFEDRVVFLGSVTTDNDRRPLPVRILAPHHDNAGLRQPGVISHLQAFRSYQSQVMIHAVSDWLVFACALLMLASWFISASIRRILLIAGCSGLLFLIFDTWLLSQGHYLAAGGPVALLLLGTAGRAIQEARLAMRERRRLRSMFSGYVSPTVLTSILDGRLSFQQGGELRRVCVLFSDIRSFTRRSEDQRPEVVIALLNRYFDLMVDCIHDLGGTVDKFIGDGLMAFFGAPNGMGSPADTAMECAVSMLEKLEQLNQELEREGTDSIQIGIGLHVGEVVVGHVGSAGRHEYTAIGDTVNVAARLEGLCKDTDRTIVVSAEVAEELDTAYPLDALGLKSLRGHSPKPVFAYRSPQ